MSKFNINAFDFKTTKEYKSALNAFNIGSMFSVGSDSKTVKGEKLGFNTAILYLMPELSLCPMSKRAGCFDACLVSAGRGKFNSVKQARTNKTKLFKENPSLFFSALIFEIKKLKKKYGNTLVIRLNGTSDIPFELYHINYKGEQYDNIFNLFDDVQFYDYSKRANRLNNGIIGKTKNYHLTLSYSESSASYSRMILTAAKRFNANFAVVFKGALPSEYKGFPVINGDDTDLRFLDDNDQPYIIGLKAKGDAKKDATGFVVDSNIIAKV